MRWRDRASAFALVALASTSVGAAPPDAAAGGYWLSVELTGPPASRAAALRDLGPDPDLEAAPEAVPDHVVGRAATLEQAVAWVATEIFDGPAIGDGEEPLLLREPAAPVPGGRLWRDHGTFLVRMTVTAANADGPPREIGWPRAAADALPEDLPWRVTELAPEKAPLFAAPAPKTPPMRERHAIVSRAGALYRLGTFDRCAGEGESMVCLRWAQVVAREGGRFVGGYLPAHQLADPDAWVRGHTAFPAVTAVHSGVAGSRAQILVRGHAVDGTAHQTTVLAPLVDGRLPACSVGLAGKTIILEIEGQPTQRLKLDDSLDKFPRE